MSTVALIEGILRLTRTGKIITRDDNIKIRELLYFLIEAKSKNETRFESLDEFIIASNALDEWSMFSDDLENTCLTDIQNLTAYQNLSHSEELYFLSILPKILDSEQIELDDSHSLTLRTVIQAFIKCIGRQ